MILRKGIRNEIIAKVTKCVWQYHNGKEELAPVFEYKSCANEAIRTGIANNLTSKYSLHYHLYHKLRIDSEFHSRYVYGALECAASRLKLYKKTIKKTPTAKKPYISRNHLILDNQSYKIDKDTIRIPTKPQKYLFVRLTRYILETIKNVKLGNLVITDNKIILSYSRIVPEKKVSGFIGIDRNLDNVTTCDSQGRYIMYDLSQANRIIESYRRVKSNFKRNDSRIRKRIFQKYGRLQKNRIHNILHCTSKNTVSRNHGIIMENLKGIRKLYQKGNGQGRKYRAKMNSWPFYELQRQIEYKARWLGLPVTYVNAGGTSTKCARCGSRLVPEEHRMVSCPFCKSKVDRDVNAAHNILLRGTRVVPDGVAVEAVMAEPGIRQPVICRVDAAKSSLGYQIPLT